MLLGHEGLDDQFLVRLVVQVLLVLDLQRGLNQLLRQLFVLLKLVVLAQNFNEWCFLLLAVILYL